MAEAHRFARRGSRSFVSDDNRRACWPFSVPNGHQTQPSWWRPHVTLPGSELSYSLVNVAQRLARVSLLVIFVL